jgi:hypothetical protein
MSQARPMNMGLEMRDGNPTKQFQRVGTFAGILFQAVRYVPYIQLDGDECESLSPPFPFNNLHKLLPRFATPKCESALSPQRNLGAIQGS